MAAEEQARKRELRAQRRGAVSRGDAAAAQRRLLALPELRDAETVALYAALPDEVPLGIVFDTLGRRGVLLVYPRVNGDDLVFAAGKLQPGYRGIAEPSAAEPPRPLDEIDAFVVPGVLFDRAGVRLGRGTGFYDRALARARADASPIGLCYADRIAAPLPREEWDAIMNVVVTDREVIRPSPAGRT